MQAFETETYVDVLGVPVPLLRQNAASCPFEDRPGVMLGGEGDDEDEGWVTLVWCLQGMGRSSHF